MGEILEKLVKAWDNYKQALAESVGIMNATEEAIDDLIMELLDQEEDK